MSHPFGKVTALCFPFEDQHGIHQPLSCKNSCYLMFVIGIGDGNNLTSTVHGPLTSGGQVEHQFGPS